ncbi:MAG: tRNA pseudouridine(38-40) synthase TruA [Flavobacteriales bacterium]|nr:tRNA pseudouridine(38-40) synthase TruA [Flavobacteriales bacterium]
MRFFLRLAYRGTHYSGWQVQPNALSVQEVINKQLSLLLRSEIETVGCGRTDTGVHARDFYLHFDFKSLPFAPQDVVYKLNGMLPDDIAVYEVIEVPAEAHARFDATNRGYEYHLHTVKNPFIQGLSAFVRYNLDLELMNKACELLLRTSDFAAFCKSGSDVHTTLCEVRKAQWTRTEQGMVFEIEANRFLRNMVRAIVGTMIDLGRGHISLEDFHAIVQSGERSKASASADACGLFLTKVQYPFL